MKWQNVAPESVRRCGLKPWHRRLARWLMPILAMLLLCRQVTLPHPGSVETPWLESGRLSLVVWLTGRSVVVSA